MVMEWKFSDAKRKRYGERISGADIDRVSKYDFPGIHKGRK